MIGALIVAARRVRPAAVAAPTPVESPVQVLVRELASLDDEFERTPDANDATQRGL